MSRKFTRCVCVCIRAHIYVYGLHATRNTLDLIFCGLCVVLLCAPAPMTMNLCVNKIFIQWHLTNHSMFNSFLLFHVDV